MTRVELLKTQMVINGGKINSNNIIATEIIPGIEIALFFNTFIIFPENNMPLPLCKGF
jgi:hypothetical protein